MEMNKRPTRKTNRLRQYDYSQAGYYFVTLCIQNRACLLGDVVKDNMTLNNAGNMIENSWRQVPDYYDGVEIDSCQIMPNHLHGIIILAGASPRANVGTGPLCLSRTTTGGCLYGVIVRRNWTI